MILIPLMVAAGFVGADIATDGEIDKKIEEFFKGKEEVVQTCEVKTIKDSDRSLLICTDDGVNFTVKDI